MVHYYWDQISPIHQRVVKVDLSRNKIYEYSFYNAHLEWRNTLTFDDVLPAYQNMLRETTFPQGGHHLRYVEITGAQLTCVLLQLES